MPCFADVGSLHLGCSLPDLLFPITHLDRTKLGDRWALVHVRPVALKTLLRKVRDMRMLEESVFAFLAFSSIARHSCAQLMFSCPACGLPLYIVLSQCRPYAQTPRCGKRPSELRVSTIQRSRASSSNATPIDLAATAPHLHRLSPHQNMQRPVQRHLTIPSPIHKLSP